MRKSKKNNVVIGILMSVFLCCSGAPSFADDDIQAMKEKMDVMNQTIAQMQETIQQMQKTIQRYETKPVVPEHRAPSSLKEDGDVATLKEEVRDLKDSINKFVKINGYYDFEYADTDQAGSPGEFKQHHLSIFLDKRLDKYHFFSEVEFEYAFDVSGSGGAVTGGGEAKVETTWFEYTHSDLVNIRAGKLLGPQYWAVNHYPSVTLSTSRPLLVKNVFPFDNTAVSVYGTKYFDNDFGLTYNTFVGNGEAPNRSKDDVTDDKAWGGRLTAHIPLFDRFDISASSYIGEDASRELRQLWGADAQLNIGDFELLTEVEHGSRLGAFGFYVQPSYHFLPKWAGFYRLDSRDDNHKIDAANDSIRHTWGVRYQPDPKVSLKTEIYRDLRDDRTKERFNGIMSSVVFFF